MLSTHVGVLVCVLHLLYQVLEWQYCLRHQMIFYMPGRQVLSVSLSIPSVSRCLSPSLYLSIVSSYSSLYFQISLIAGYRQLMSSHTTLFLIYIACFEDSD